MPSWISVSDVCMGTFCANKNRSLVFRQNGDSFREKTGNLRKLFKKQIDFTYISAPHTVLPVGEGDTDGQPKGGPFLSWWFTRENKAFNGHDVTNHCFGFDESLTVINSAFDAQGPFDGILGFSQGACLASLICALRESNEFKHDFKFVLLVSGFPSGCSKHAFLYKNKIQINSLHVMGETDNIIPKGILSPKDVVIIPDYPPKWAIKMSQKLSECFESPELLFHPGGHFVSLSGPCKHKFLEYFNKMLNDIEKKHEQSEKAS